MKRQNILFFGFLLLNWAVRAQDFEQLRPNASPAYMLLGVSPTEVERPTTPKEFIAGVQAASVNGKLAPNLAMEFTPYELLSASRNDPNTVKAKRYLLDDGYGLNLARSLSISFATSESDTVVMGSLGRGTSASLGMKLLLCHGRLNRTTTAALLQLTSGFSVLSLVTNINSLVGNNYSDGDDVLLADLQAAIDAQLAAEQRIVQADQRLTDSEKAKGMGLLHAKADEMRAAIQTAANGQASINAGAVKGVLASLSTSSRKAPVAALNVLNNKFAFAREGFMLEANAAFLGHFVQNSWDSLQAAKYAVWLTPSYRLNLNKNQFDDVLLLDFIGLARYTGNNINVDTASYVDMGGKLQFTFNKLTMSAEYVGRILPEFKNASGDLYYTDRITGSLEYVLNNLITLRASFGRTFNGHSSVYDKPSDALFGMGGLALSFLNNQGL
jgi:hypothetical protein